MVGLVTYQTGIDVAIVVEIAAALAPPEGLRKWRRQQVTRLTPKELEVCCHLIAGRRNRGIADALVLSEKTVEAHKSHIAKKLELASVSELRLLLMREYFTRLGRKQALAELAAAS